MPLFHGRKMLSCEVVALCGTRVIQRIRPRSKHVHPNAKATGRGESARGSADFSPHRTLNAFWYKKMRTEVRAPRLPPADGAQRNNLAVRWAPARAADLG